MRIRAIAISCALIAATAACSSQSLPTRAFEGQQPDFAAEISGILAQGLNDSVELHCGDALIVVTAANPSKGESFKACAATSRTGTDLGLKSLGAIASTVIDGGKTLLLRPGGQIHLEIAAGGAIEVEENTKLTEGTAAWQVLVDDSQSAKPATARFFACLRRGSVAQCLTQTEPGIGPSVVAALQAPHTVNVLAKALKSVAATSYVTYVDAPLGESHLPLLGINLNPDLIGLDQIKPPKLVLTADGHTFAKRIHWSSWGGQRAVGTGDADYDNALEPVRVVAYNLGSCEGYRAYQRVTWFFPSHGQKFAAVGGFRTCTKLGGFAKRRG